MFTGIIEETGAVISIKTGARSTRLVVRARAVVPGLKMGSSLAVNGACLTVVARRAGRLTFDVLNETLRRTNLRAVAPGAVVNLERPLRADGRLDGHFVLGHVDATGTVRRLERVGADVVFEIAAPPSVMRYIIEKGSVAVDGISLTVATVGRGWFRVWIVPYTLGVTNLQARCAGELVNLEADVVGKYVEKFALARRRG